MNWKVKRLICSVLWALVVPTLAWIGGYDGLLERGPNTAAIAVASVFIFGFSYSCPYWNRYD